MNPSPAFDSSAAHRQFSVDCFNGTWSLIEKDDRSPEESTHMMLQAAASLWHWTQRADCTRRNLSIGYWQVSRVFALLGYGELARRFAEHCLEYSEGDAPFYLGYAYEALARAASLLSDSAEAQRCLDQAAQLAQSVTDAESRQHLVNDLATITP